MNKENKKLSTRVQELRNSTQAEIFFSPPLLEAMRLADLFESITPNTYILPLDALAGFHTKSEQD